MKRYLIAVILLLSVLHPDAGAQIFRRNHARTDEKAPKIILVQLFTYQRRIEHFNKLHQPEKAKQAKTDADSVIKKMVMDFSDNFSYCPVYYFIDTNAKLIREKKFKGIILDKNLQPVDIDPGKEYQIVLFGFPVDMISDVQTGNDDYYDTDYVIGDSKQKLVVLDGNYKKLKKPLPNGSNNKMKGALARPYEEYLYQSPLFEIYYRPYAKGLSVKMSGFY